jgi:hypothetical protein
MFLRLNTYGRARQSTLDQRIVKRETPHFVRLYPKESDGPSLKGSLSHVRKRNTLIETTANAKQKHAQTSNTLERMEDAQLLSAHLDPFSKRMVSNAS